MSSPSKFAIIIPPQDISCDPGCLERLANGDRSAFAWLYKNYSKRIYDYAMLITANESTSEDIVQEVFLKLWQHRQKLPDVKDFNGYLYIIYRNHIRDVLNKHEKETIVRKVYFRDTSVTVHIPDEILVYKEKQQFIAQAVNRLPHRQKLVYKLSREHGWKRERIAQELKISPLTVREQLRKATKSLKKNF